VDIEKLSQETGFPVRTLRSFVAGKKIPFLKLGHRTVRFDVSRVEATLQRFEIPAIKAK